MITAINKTKNSKHIATNLQATNRQLTTIKNCINYC